VLTISHNKAFVNELCNETWNVGEGVVETVAIDGKSAGGSKVAARRAAKQGVDADEAALSSVKDNTKLSALEAGSYTRPLFSST
jgi:elongation factor 3